MIAKVCDICGKVESPERRDFHTFTHEWGCFKRVKDFHICSECMNLIKELRAKQKVTSEWIPASDRLPEEYESVLFSTNFGDVLVGFLTSSKQWTVESAGYPYVEYGVLAWMPLPDPFVAGADDDI